MKSKKNRSKDKLTGRFLVDKIKQLIVQILCLPHLSVYLFLILQDFGPVPMHKV